MNITRFLTTLLLSALFSTATYAEVVKQKKLNFLVRGELIEKDIFYSFDVGDNKSLKKNFPNIAKLDSLSVLNKSGAFIVVSKIAYVIEKPIGIFDHESLVSEELVSSLLGDQKVKKDGPHTFKVQVPETDLAYVLNVYSDSDDVSTLPHSKVTESITAFKKLDVISQSAPSISLHEMSQFTKLLWGATKVSSYIPLKENKTLVISYYLSVYKEKMAEKDLEENLIQEFIHSQKTYNQIK